MKLKSSTPEDALASWEMTPEFNLKFNQKSTTRGSQEGHFSHLSNVEEEGTCELGEYFSDDEEDDTWDQENLTSLASESNSWSHTGFNYPQENFPPDLNEWDPVISTLETIHEGKFEDNGETNQLHHLFGFSEEARLSFSTWQPYIPLEHAFLNCAAQSQPLDSLSQASFLQEPTLTRISTISTSTKQTSSPMEPTSHRLNISLSRGLRQTELPDPLKQPSKKLRKRPYKPSYSPTYSAKQTLKRPSFTNFQPSQPVKITSFQITKKNQSDSNFGSSNHQVRPKPAKTRIPDFRVRHRQQALEASPTGTSN
jgi:hypothetical protein